MGWLYPFALVGAIFGLAISIALIINFITVGGLAICKIDDEFMFYYPFARKKIATAGTKISKTEYSASVPHFQVGAKSQLVIALQVTVRRAGQPDLIFRTALLREPADTIVERMSTLAK
jgi:hypothetical protein